MRELPVLSSIPEIFCRILISPAEKPCKLTAAVIEYSWFIRRRCETISGAADTYWGQNKGRSMEGALVKSTKFLAVLFIVLALVLNLKFFN